MKSITTEGATVTTTKTRSDIHSPINLVPEDYRWIGCYAHHIKTDDEGNEIGEEAADRFGRYDEDSDIYAAIIKNERDGEAGLVRYGNGHQCDHCGARINYVGLFEHLPTGQVISVGEQCASGRLTYSKAQFDHLRKTAALDRKAQRLLAEWNEYRVSHTDTDWTALDASNNGFIKDVLGKGRRYGSISDRQLSAIKDALVRDAAKADEPAETLVPVPEGRNTVEGVLLSTKVQESHYGTTIKILVKVTTPEGSFKVWGTKPESLQGVWGCTGCESTLPVHKDTCEQVYGYGYIGTAERGDTVRFTATFERSAKDESFGFFKRPTKASVISTAKWVV